jgi:hypothetical protein
MLVEQAAKVNATTASIENRLGLSENPETGHIQRSPCADTIEHAD